MNETAVEAKYFAPFLLDGTDPIDPETRRDDTSPRRGARGSFACDCFKAFDPSYKIELPETKNSFSRNAKTSQHVFWKSYPDKQPEKSRPHKDGACLRVPVLRLLSGRLLYARIHEETLSVLIKFVSPNEPLLLKQTHDELHQGRFGFPMSNYLALMPLDNTWCNSWTEFFRRRLADQIEALLKVRTRRQW